MVDTGELENYLNEKSAKEGDMVEILEEGIREGKEDPQTHRKYNVLNLPVKLNGSRDVIYSPNKEAIAVFQKAYGMNTTGWIGKKFTIKFYPKTAFGVTKTAILPMLIEQTKV